jgi:hypothetical protein
MITEIRLSQIKDTYTGNETILIPLIKLLKKSPSNIEFVVVFRSPEWVSEMQVYEPAPIFSYLVKAYKLAYPSSIDQRFIYINALVYDDLVSADDEASRDNISDHQQNISIESSKLKVLINKGDKFITAYANNILKEKESENELSQFSKLVNEAEVSNDSK